MIRLIVGPKGYGKTKQLIDMMNDSVRKAKGNLVCIEKGMETTYHINANIRIIDIDDYDIDNYTKFYGFFAGVLAGNYDIEQVYIDGLLRIGKRDIEALGNLLDRMEKISSDKEIIVTVSATLEELTDNVKKYL